MLFGLFTDTKLQHENDSLKAENDSLKVESANFKSENANLKADNLKLMGKVSSTDTACANLKADNLKLMGRVSAAEAALPAPKGKAKSINRLLKANLAKLMKDLDEKKEENEDLKDQVKDLKGQINDLKDQVKELESEDNGKKVTFAEARKVMNKEKLKDLRASLQAVPNSATGFSAQVSVYDNKTKRLKVVELKSKAEALELVSKAEKGNVDIVI